MTQTTPSDVGTFKMPMSQVTQGLTIRCELTGLRSWKVRLWLGTVLIYLGAWITGMNAEVDIKEVD